MELSIDPRQSLRLAIITDLHYSPAANPSGRYHNAFATDTGTREKRFRIVEHSC